MKWAAVLVLATVSLQEPPADEATRRAERIRQALEWLEKDEPEVRAMGTRTLLELGRSAAPAIQKRLEEKGAAELVRILRLIDPGSAETWVSEQELENLKLDEDVQKEAAKVPREAAERYLALKYYEALASAKGKNYQRGFDLANALLTLEPHSVHAEKFKRLRRHCQTMITQTTLIEAKIVQPRIWFVEGEPIELLVRMKNIYSKPITLAWDQGNAQEPGGGLLILELEIRMHEMGGAGAEEHRPQEMRFEAEVPIAPGAQWERAFTLDVSTAIPDTEQVKVVTVNGWTQPAKVDVDGANITRRLQFEPAIVRIVPRKYAVFVEKPLESLKQVMETGIAQEAFICCQMLEGKQKDQGAEMLIQWMETAESRWGRAKVAQILAGFTGQSLGEDPRRWREWLENKDKDKKKK